MKNVLTIAGFDPTGGAGIQADLKVFYSLGVYGLSAVTSITAQNTKGVEEVLPITPIFLKKQLSVLLSDVQTDAVKIGMIYSEKNVAVIELIVKKYSLKNIVLDPLIFSSSGKRLVEEKAVSRIKNKLFQLCKVITPNINEASALTGIEIKNEKDMEKAAVRLKSLGPENVIITGGHLDKTAADIFYNGKFHYLIGKKIQGEFHGTGCAFSSAITAFIAKGEGPLEAARLAKNFMNKALRKSFYLGKNMMLLDI
jgi:hydroxymethylpyrimidine/phosphomethylpyrimidine kinase